MVDIASAASTLADPRLLLLVLVGVLVGSTFAAIPGLGGIVPLGILIPWAVQMSAPEMVALLFPVIAVANTANSFPSILMAVPGSSGAQATILDGYPMAQNGEARRAFGAAFASSAVGGLLGTAAMLVVLPFVRPIVIQLGSPELFTLILLALMMVGVLSSGAPLQGIAGAGLGLLLAMIGADSKSGISRFTFDQPHLWDGVSLLVIGIGLFAVPEMVDLAASRSSIAKENGRQGSILQGIRDTLASWWLSLRCAAIGTFLGILPGIGGSVVDWMGYAHAAQSERDTTRFGRGDVRGVIAPESSNSAKMGGALVTTLAFGIPGSAAMAFILIAMRSTNVSPGPELLTQERPLLYLMILVVALSVILATAISLALAPQIAKVASLPYQYIVPVVLTLILAAAFNANRIPADIILLIIISAAGVWMKRYGWPRPAVMLGAVLGAQAENYLWLSWQRYEFAWLLRPGVLVIFALMIVVLAFPLIRKYRRGGGRDQGPLTEPEKALVATDGVSSADGSEPSSHE